MLTVTSLVSPTMIVKIRQGLKYAALGQGHMMNGHGNRVYITNRKGHNILRLDWKHGKFIAYGSESRDVTEMVKEAIQRGCSSNRVKPRSLDCDVPTTPNDKAKALVAGNPSLKARLMHLASLLALVLLVALPSVPAYADKPPTALESECFKNPHLLVCQWIADSVAESLEKEFQQSEK